MAVTTVVKVMTVVVTVLAVVQVGDDSGGDSVSSGIKVFKEYLPHGCKCVAFVHRRSRGMAMAMLSGCPAFKGMMVTMASSQLWQPT
jgi:hypothetical protein